LGFESEMSMCLEIKIGMCLVIWGQEEVLVALTGQDFDPGCDTEQRLRQSGRLAGRESGSAVDGSHARATG